MAHGFLRRLFEVFERCKTPVDVVTTSEVSVSVTIDDRAAAAGDRRGAVGIRRRSSAKHDMAIVCVVGDGLHDDPALVGQVLRVGRRRADAHGVAGGVAAEHHLRDSRSRPAARRSAAFTTSSSPPVPAPAGLA